MGRGRETLMDRFMEAAIEQARVGAGEGGIPIGAVLVRGDQILGQGRNRRVQAEDPVLHAEIDCLRNAGRVGSYHGTVLYSTLMPCVMCAGAVVQFQIPKVVVGESENFAGAREFLQDRGVEVVELHSAECVELLGRFIRANPDLWREDIGTL
jgi:cytosine/creatinine deaminase